MYTFVIGLGFMFILSNFNFQCCMYFSHKMHLFKVLFSLPINAERLRDIFISTLWDHKYTETINFSHKKKRKIYKKN